MHIDPRIPPLLVGDDAKLRQILLHIVGNAIKFTERGGLTVECSLLPFHPGGKQVVLLVISDTGIGIPDEKIGKIFEAFTQLDGSRTRRYMGTGLGLVIVKRLIDLMGGTLAVDSEVGRGTTFYCSLPFSEVKETIYKVPMGDEDKGEGVSLTCLVAEDDPFSQITVCKLLRKKGYTAFCVNNGLQALEALRLMPFDCLISDIQMPEMDGLELIDSIRAGRTGKGDASAETRELLGLDAGAQAIHPVPAGLPIVALTAHAMAGDKEHFLEAGADYYLVKPIMASELYQILSDIGKRLRSAKRPPAVTVQ